MSRYRKDRWGGYGGVLVAVKSDYISELIDTENNTESIFIKISLHNNKSLIVGSIYRPPNSDINYMEKIKSIVDNVLRKNRTSIVSYGLEEIQMYQSTRYLLENTIYHWPPKHIANKQYIPRFSSRQSLGAGHHIPNKERTHVRLIPN
jgi:hypothetical protein